MKPIIAFLVAFVLFSPNTFATDCNSDCRKNCTNRWKFTDPLCNMRCSAEREIACRFGIKSCDAWRANALAPHFFAGVEMVQAMNRNWGTPRDVHSCHSAVDRLGTGVALIGLGKGAYDAYQDFWKWANGLASRANLAAWLVKEGALHLSHCVCSGARYVEPGAKPDGVPAQNNDHFYSSIRGTERWGLGFGNAFDSQRIHRDTELFVGESRNRVERGYFSSSSFNTAEAICEGKAHHMTGQGIRPLKELFEFVKRQNWAHCLFRVTPGMAHNPPFQDLYMTSAASTESGGWTLFHGPGADAEKLIQRAEAAIPRADLKSGELFSSSRLTRTIVHCRNKTATINGLEIAGGEEAYFAGWGPSSLLQAFDYARKNRLSACTFDAADSDFGQPEW